MAKLKTWLFFALLCCFVIGTAHADAYYKFENKAQAQKFQTLTKSVRCLVCENQNIMESNSLFADQLKADILEKIQAGQSQSQILADLEARFGSQILYDPPFNWQFLLLWSFPFLILLALFSFWGLSNLFL